MGRFCARIMVFIVLAGLHAGALAAAGGSEPAANRSTLGRLPVKEIAVFKDGHAFVMHEGMAATDGAGNVVLNQLPRPLLGAFWPYSGESNARLASASAARRRVRTERTALDLASLIRANVGRKVMITEAANRDDPNQRYGAVIAAFPTRSSEELAATSNPDAEEALPQKGEIVLLKTDKGTKALPLSRVQDVTFIEGPNPRVADEEFRNLLTLQLDWRGGAPARQARVGFAYVEKGMRWVPSYKVTLDDKGNARVQLQATLINEMTDLDNVTVSLVVGVPSFAFKDLADPMALQSTLAQVSAVMPMDSRWSNMLSNAVMTQAPTRVADQQPAPGRTQDLGPDPQSDGMNEDLHVFTLRGISLRKGERLVAPVADFSVPCRDLYELNIPFGAPNDLMRQIPPDQQQEIARLLAAPKVMHLVRLKNTQKHPLTTGPALILQGNRVLAQSLLAYTPVNAEVDLELTAAINIPARVEERESKRDLRALVIDDTTYVRVEQSGEITLTNRGARPVVVEVVRSLSGMVDNASGNGKVEKVGPAEGTGSAPASGGTLEAWRQIRWPEWYGRLNMASQVRWSVELKPGETANRNYGWHYFWR